MMANKPVLGYWQIRGLANPIRFLFHYLEVDFEDKTYGFTPDLPLHRDHWNADKESLGLPYPNLPYLLDGSHKITESRAIMKHLCRTRKPELLGKTSEIQAKVDMTDYFIYDLLYTAFIPVIYHFTEEKMKEYKEEVEPTKLRYLSDFMKNNKWITGDDITYVDFIVYEVLHHLTVYDSKALDRFPKLVSFVKQFEELPSIKAYMSSQKFISKPCYSPTAIIKI